MAKMQVRYSSLRELFTGSVSAGSSWRSARAGTLRVLNIVPTETDPDVRIRLAKEKSEMECYTMVFVLIDDILALSEDAKGVIESIGEFYTVKPGSDKTPELYLGANVENTQTPDGKESPTSSSGSCVKNAIKTAEDLLVEDGKRRTISW